MKKRWNLFQILGVLLILSSLGFLIFTQLQAVSSQKKTTTLCAQIEALLPQRTSGMAGSYSNPEMPILQLQGDDFIGLVEVSAFGLKLPIGSEWDTSKLTAYPCRLYGSVYNSTLILGGSDQAGQFDFFKNTDLGCVVTVTDMTGAEYTYTVFRVDRSKTADADKLMDQGSDLTLYVRDRYSMDYIILRCHNSR